MSERSGFVAVMVAGAVLCGTTLLLSATPRILPFDAPQPAGTHVSPDYGIDLDKSITLFEKRVAERDQDFLSRNLLGQLYLKRARLTENGDDFTRAAEQFQSALAIHSGDIDASLGLAAVAMANHEFAEALRLAQKVFDANPDHLMALAVVGDAQMELGKYDAAAKSINQLAAKIQTAPVQARRARLAEVRGDVEDAAYLLRDAWQQAQGATAEDEAWYVEQLGTLALRYGEHQQAIEALEYVRRLTPQDRHALRLLGQARARMGDFDQAEDLYWESLRTTDDPLALAAIGDLRTVQGRPDEAGAYYQRAIDLWEHAGADDHDHQHHHEHQPLPGEPPGRHVHGSWVHSHANADAYSRTLSVFLSDHDRDVERALDLARRNHQTRQDIESEDALAWALYRNGKHEAAHEAIQRALAQGTMHPGLWFHRGMIETALGQTDAAIESLTRALQIDPQFSVLDAQVARDTLQRLQAE